MVTTTLIAIMKRETNAPSKVIDENLPPSNEPQELKLSVIQTYKVALKILNNPPMQTFAAVLLTVRIMWADYDGVGFLKFLDSGISNKKMVPLSALSGVPVQLVVSCLVARFAASTTPTRTYVYAIPCRTLLALTGALIIYITPKLIPEDGVAPNYIYFVYLGNHILYTFASSTMQLVITAFFIKISDPAVGGTYMTLLNTINNIGWAIPHTVALWMVDVLTWRDCTLSDTLHTNGTIVANAINATAEVILNKRFVVRHFHY